MKKSQKILVAVLCLVAVAIIALIIFIKAPDKPTSPNGENISTNIQNDNVLHNSGEKISETTGAQMENSPVIDNENNQTTASKHSNNNINNNPADKTDKNNKKPNQSYNLDAAEIMNTQKTSFGELKLYSTKSVNKDIYLLELNHNNGNKFYYEIPGEYIIENIYYANVDERFGEEILVRAWSGKINEPGNYATYVLKITNTEFVSLLSSSEIKKFTQTFTAELKPNYNISVYNKTSGFSETINVNDINSKFASSVWNNDGSILSGKTSADVIFEEAYNGFEPRDVDNDGIHEIVCTQSTSIGNKVNVIGYAATTLKFNYDSGKFEIFATDFYKAS